MRKPYILLLTISVFMLVNCQGRQSAGTQDTPSLQQATAILPMTNESPILTKGIGSLLLSKCLNVSDNGSEYATLSGRLIIESDVPHATNLFDLETKTQILFDNGIASNVQVSPDRKWIAFIRDELLVVQSEDGSKSYEFPTQSEEWQTISHWLNNEMLVLWNHSAPLDSLVLFSPFTGTKEFLANEFPDILPTDDDWDFYWPSITIYSPSLIELLYVAKEEDSFQPGYSKLVLWNIKDKQAVTEIMDFGYSIVPPLWNSNGDGALYVKSVEGYDPPVAHDELFYLSSKGETRQLTHLIDYFEYARVLNYSLSSDEKYLAMVLEIRSKEGNGLERKLLVLDMLSLEIKDLCLFPDRFAPLIWSPDGYKLALSQTPQTGTPTTIVVDIINENVFGIVDNFKPRGWLR